METRSRPRIQINLKIVSKIDESSQQKFGLASGASFEANVLDISESGIGLLSKYFFPKGLILELDIDGASFGLKEIMKIKGEVRYCKFIRGSGYRSGIKFLNISDTYRKAISQFIATYERRKEPRVKLAD